MRTSLPYLTSADLLTLTQLLTALVLSSSPEQDIFSNNAGILSLISQCVAMVMHHNEAESKELLLGTLEQILVVKETREDMFLYNR